MKEKDIKVYGYRWVVLGVFFLINLIMQLHWIMFAPITSEAVIFYDVNIISIGFLSMIFVFVYLVVSIPASYIIDRFGVYVGVGIGAVLTGIFGLLKGFYGSDFTTILMAQLGIAVAQPFILNAVTAVAARWFPIHERATATGISVLAQLLGIGIAMAVTPILFETFGMNKMLMIYGIATVIVTVVFLVFMRGKPPTPPEPSETYERHTVFEGLKHILGLKDMAILIFVFFIAMGMFNAVTTWIEQIVAPRGFDIAQAGIVGAIMLGGGILGAIIVPPISDRYKKRKPFLMYSIILTTPGLIGLAFATNFWLLLASSFVFGFFFMAAGPIGFQYGAEISHPAPEATSQGLLVLAGQISGIIFIFGMEMLRDASGTMAPFMIAYVGMMVLNILLCSKLKESKMMGTLEEK